MTRWMRSVVCLRSCGRREMGTGRWEMGDGKWEMEDGRYVGVAGGTCV